MHVAPEVRSPIKKMLALLVGAMLAVRPVVSSTRGAAAAPAFASRRAVASAAAAAATAAGMPLLATARTPGSADVSEAVEQIKDGRA